MKNKKKIILISSVFLFIIFASVAYYLWIKKPNKKDCTAVDKQATVSAKNLPVISKAKLKAFDGVKNQKIYLGFDCLVYDVTAGKESYYGLGKDYHYLVGRDATEQLNIFGGGIIKTKYPVVGILGE